MPLSEAQVQRYSRQILLKEVGGRGQLKLLAAPFEVGGQGPALDVAVAYLAASGTPLRTAWRHAGFVDGVVLSAFAPDAEAPGAVVGWVGPLEALAGAPAALHRVGVGQGVVVAVRATTPAPAALPPGEEAEPVTLGALAALLAQRLVLGLEPEGVAVARFSAGRWVRDP